MDHVFQQLFSIPGTNDPVFYHGQLAAGSWVTGQLKSREGLSYAQVCDGAAYFVAGTKDRDGWGSDAEIEQYLRRPRAGLIYDDYRQRCMPEHLPPYNVQWIKGFSSRLDGLILEVAVGPQGGIFPYLLELDRDKVILVNDLGRWIIEDWKTVTDSERLGTTVGFAQFDLAACPIRSNSIDYILSNQGVTNTCDVESVVSELQRILSPTGAMFLEESTFSSETFDRLPAEGQAEARRNWPNSDWEWLSGVFKRHGLVVREKELFGHGESWPVKGYWGDFGQKYGIVPVITDLYHLELAKAQ